jgi:mono/diheme cytochrome c family protein
MNMRVTDMNTVCHPAGSDWRDTTLLAVIAAATALAFGSPTVARAETPVESKATGSAQQPASIERGRYLVRTSGCNDCHTPGYAEAAGNLPESQWLTGLRVGFQGPWGVSYPANLRLTMRQLSEDQWLASARAPRLPPMPWFSLRDMSDDDLRAMYRFVRSLGEAGQPVPAAMPPGSKATTPVIVFVPQTPESVHANR